MSRSPENPDPEVAETAADVGFLRRWSRRKLDEPVDSASSQDLPGPVAVPLDGDASLTSEVPLPDPDKPTVQPSPAASDLATGDATASDSAAGDEVILTDKDMPPVESLTADSDFTPFMSSGVSRELRQLALKKLFFSGLFGARDGLDDYDDDFTRFEPLGDTITSDMKYHMRRAEKERLAREQEELDAAELDQAELDEGESAEAGHEELQPDAAEADTPQQPGAESPAQLAQDDARSAPADAATDSQAGQPSAQYVDTDASDGASISERQSNRETQSR